MLSAVVARDGLELVNAVIAKLGILRDLSEFLFEHVSNGSKSKFFFLLLLILLPFLFLPSEAGLTWL
jgi:hypothetical protein